MTRFILTLNAAFFALMVSMTAQGMDMSKDEKMQMMHMKMSKMHGMAGDCMKKGKNADDCKMMMMKDCKMGDEKCKKMMAMMEDSMSKMMDEGMMDDMMPMKKGKMK